MNDIQIFNNPEFGEVRTIIIDGEPWFVAKDISEKLGYTYTSSMVRQIDDEDKMIFDSASEAQSNFSTMSRRVGVINESGLYVAIMGSRLKTAKKFRKWVTSEVLPSIRKTGAYSSYQLPQTTDGKIALLAQGHVELKQEVDSIRTDLEALKMDLPILPIEADRIVVAVKKRGVSVLGGKNSAAYNNIRLRRKIYSNIYGRLKFVFDVKSYKQIKRCQCDVAIEIINNYDPPCLIQQEIICENSQQKFDF